MPSIFFRRKNTSSTNSTNNDHTLLENPRNHSITSNNESKKTRKQLHTNYQTFRVKIPNVRCGETFQVYVGDRLMKIKCPPNAIPGQSIAVRVQKDDKVPSQSTNSDTRQKEVHSPNVNPIPGTNPPAYMVTIPIGVRGGQQFPVKINEVDLMVTSPHNALPGMSVRIVPPKMRPHKRVPSNKGQMFEVEVPEGVSPGETFALLANGIRISVKCPQNASPGQTVQFYLPFRANDGSKNPNCVVQRLNYDVDGWTRTLQISEMKFQWVRVQKNSANDAGEELRNRSVHEHILKLAYVTQLSDNEGLDFLPAQLGKTGSSVLSPQTGKILASCTDLIAIQTQDFNDKINSFGDLCKKIGNHGRYAPKICIQVRREFLLEDSLEAVMSLDSEDLKNVWRFQFLGEEGVDAGGLKREWFELVSGLLLNPDSGLWTCCEGNQMNLQVNPSSGISCDDDLLMFRFLGRVLGKAIFDQQLISGHMVQYIYKHLLGWPITFADLEHLDPVFYKSLHDLIEMEDVEYACLDFTTMEECMGAVNVVPLLPDGANIDVTSENLIQYLETIVEYRLIKRIQNQLKELLLGFTEVVPRALLTIFDYQELELLMCGLPNIDVDDWMENTRYSGLYYSRSNEEQKMHPVCIWFWEVVREMSEERRAKLLQFVTGTSGVPSRGFSVLQGNGEIRLFQIHGVSMEGCVYPRAHTCFNRIDLPTYDSKAALKEKLNIAITMVSTGFDME